MPSQKVLNGVALYPTVAAVPTNATYFAGLANQPDEYPHVSPLSWGSYDDKLMLQFWER